MKKLLPLVVVVALVALAAVFLARRPAAPPQDESSQASPGAAPKAPPPPPFVAPPRPVVENVAPEPDSGGEVEQVVHVYPEQVLATINGTAITLKDLAGVAGMKREKDQVLSRHMYDFLLSRAIDRELVFQEARAQGLQLTPEQKEQLAAMRAQEVQAGSGVIDLTMSPERLDLEQRDAEGRMLLVNLASASGVAPPFVTPEQVQAYYDGHRDEFGEMPADPAEAQGARRSSDAEIRRKLSADTAAAYQKGVDEILVRLRTSADVQMTALDGP